MAISLSVRHVDTCLPCYVQDHCNGDNEELIGVAVTYGDRVFQVKADLLSEVHATVSKMPDGANYEAAIDELFKGTHPLKAFSKGLDKSNNEDGESCHAWFRFTWETDDE